MVSMATCSDIHKGISRSASARRNSMSSRYSFLMAESRSFKSLSALSVRSFTDFKSKTGDEFLIGKISPNRISSFYMYSF
jgi:hypothetical protein